MKKPPRRTIHEQRRLKRMQRDLFEMNKPTIAEMTARFAGHLIKPKKP